MYLIGYDIGTSSIKATLMDAQTGLKVCSATSPDKEMTIISPKPGWTEQDPMLWWENVKIATSKLLSQKHIDTVDIHAIGISYQMHGLVLVDKNKQLLRPAIIWCDSRAVDIGNAAFDGIGRKICQERLLNSPGNFTASKLKWVKENEPAIYDRAYKAMLPGDFITTKMSGDISTTLSGLSEGILWDFKENKPADIVLNYYQLRRDLIPSIVPTFSVQGQLCKEAADELGLKLGTKISYRAGDQPNNAFSLNVLNPGEIAATAGTSGVVYGVSDKRNYDVKSRVNSFAHVNYSAEKPRLGVLLCINGAGILNSWLKHNMSGGLDYPQMNAMAATAPIGCDGLCILPYGNGAERTLENKNIGASFHNLNFSVHNFSHIARASQEGIAFAMNYGVEIMRKMEIEVKTVRAGNANMFLSPVFGQAFANTTGCIVELYDSDGSQGAARAAGIGAGIYSNFEDAFVGLRRTDAIEPCANLQRDYSEAYLRWCDILHARQNNVTAE
ncbi:MAG: carbohydrate kinase [Planctomycetes bacterium GWC2_45_44]|nr:MAG: carbohydrate kinase [Planctomycetes bacterium GWC2_45_44]